jgi:hypothetical protein
MSRLFDYIAHGGDSAAELEAQQEYEAMAAPTPMTREEALMLVEEARNIAMLICPLPVQLEGGDAIERMPDDLLRAATIIGVLCDALLGAERRGAERMRERAARIANIEVERCHMLENHPETLPDAQARYAARWVSSKDIFNRIRALPLPGE